MSAKEKIALTNKGPHQNKQLSRLRTHWLNYTYKKTHDQYNGSEPVTSMTLKSPMRKHNCSFTVNQTR